MRPMLIFYYKFRVGAKNIIVAIVIGLFSILPNCVYDVTINIFLKESH